MTLIGNKFCKVNWNVCIFVNKIIYIFIHLRVFVTLLHTDIICLKLFSITHVRENFADTVTTHASSCLDTNFMPIMKWFWQWLPCNAYMLCLFIYLPQKTLICNKWGILSTTQKYIPLHWTVTKLVDFICYCFCYTQMEYNTILSLLLKSMFRATKIILFWWYFRDTGSYRCSYKYIKKAVTNSESCIFYSSRRERYYM